MTDHPAPRHPLADLLGDMNYQYFEDATQRQARFSEFTDHQLMALATPSPKADQVRLEFERRQIEASNRLRTAMQDAKTSADRAARWLIILTGVLVVLTIALVVLTVVLVQREG